MNILPKLLLLLLVLTIVPLSILGILTLRDIQTLEDAATDNINSIATTAVDDSAVSLNELGSQLIKQRAEDVAKQLEIYITSNPTMTVADLQADEYFSSLAVQSVGETGYTAVTDVDSITCRFHASPNIVDLDLHVLAEKLPGFWSVMSKTQGGHVSEGTYDWEEPDGSIRQKYMYIDIVDAQTADGVTFSVAATTYLDEFNRPSLEIREKIGISVREVYTFLEQSGENVRSQTMWLIIGMIIVVCGVGAFFAHSLTRPITKMNTAGQKIADGDLNTELPVITSKDEIQELGDTMNLLMGAVKYLKREKVPQKAAKKKSKKKPKKR